MFIVSLECIVKQHGKCHTVTIYIYIYSSKNECWSWTSSKVSLVLGTWGEWRVRKVVLKYDYVRFEFNHDQIHTRLPHDGSIGTHGIFSYLVGGWTNPSEKYSSKWESSPNRGENKKYLKPPPSYIWLTFMVNVGKYASPMDPVGTVSMNVWRVCHFQITSIHHFPYCSNTNYNRPMSCSFHKQV